MKDADMIESIRRGEEQGLSLCMDRYTKLLWKAASSVLYRIGNEQDMEECVADAFIYLWEHPDAFDPNRGKLKSLLCIVARHRAIDRCRQILRHNTVPLEETVLVSAFGLEEAVIREEQQKELRSAVDTLGETTQEILLRRYYYDQKPREIAGALDLSVRQVNNALYRAKRQMKEALSKRKEDTYG